MCKQTQLRTTEWVNLTMLSEWSQNQVYTAWFQFYKFKNKLNRNQDSDYCRREGTGMDGDWKGRQGRLLGFWCCFLIWVLLTQMNLLCENQSRYIYLQYVHFMYIISITSLDKQEKGKHTGFQISGETDISQYVNQNV